MLIVEDGNGVVGAESYVTVAEADAYHLKMGNDQWPQPPASTPEDPTPEDPNLSKKEASLRRGAIYLDSYTVTRGVPGTKLNPKQGLLFPLVGAVDIFGNPIDGVPDIYKNAQNEVALLSYTGVQLAATVTAGPLLKRKKVDVLEKEWFEGSYSQAPIFGWLDNMLAGLFGMPVDDNELVIAQVQRS